MPMYVCEASGGRILQTGVGHALVTSDGTDDAVLDVTTWDRDPVGPVGDAVFRSVDVVIRHDAGFAIGITPIVDGVTGTEQTFSGASPAAGTDGVVTLQAFVADRGTRVAARIRQTDATGTVELADASYSFVPIRVSP